MGDVITVHLGGGALVHAEATAPEAAKAPAATPVGAAAGAGVPGTARARSRTGGRDAVGARGTVRRAPAGLPARSDAVGDGSDGGPPGVGAPVGPRVSDAR